METGNPPKKEFRVMTVKIIKELRRIMDAQNKKLKIFSKEKKIFKKTEMKNTTAEMKNILEGKPQF